jgi:erythromycin esterase-like protein
MVIQTDPTPSLATKSDELLTEINQITHPLESAEDLDPLMDLVGDARYVLLGEASHGTSEFYQWRARLSQRLIREKGFPFICVEGDWPDCYRVNRFVKGYPDAGASAREVLHAFSRWPTWMWANWEIVALAGWLRRHNQGHSNKVGFYGLDVYSYGPRRYGEHRTAGAGTAGRTGRRLQSRIRSLRQLCANRTASPV